MYFKSEKHEELFNYYLSTFSHNEENVFWFSYLVAASGKDFEKEIKNGVDDEAMLEKIKVFSSSEKHLIKLALNVFNGSCEVNLKRMIEAFDEENMKVLREYLNAITK